MYPLCLNKSNKDFTNWLLWRWRRRRLYCHRQLPQVMQPSKPSNPLDYGGWHLLIFAVVVCFCFSLSRRRCHTSTCFLLSSFLCRVAVGNTRLTVGKGSSARVTSRCTQIGPPKMWRAMESRIHADPNARRTFWRGNVWQGEIRWISWLSGRFQGVMKTSFPYHSTLVGEWANFDRRRRTDAFWVSDTRGDLVFLACVKVWSDFFAEFPMQTWW